MARNVKDLMAEARETVDEIDVEQARSELEAGKFDAVVDVRGAEELSSGMLPGAIHAPRGLLEFHADPDTPLANDALTANKEGRVLVHCASGGRSLLACKTLQELGYENVVNLGGGFKGWSQAGNPVEKPSK